MVARGYAAREYPATAVGTSKSENSIAAAMLTSVPYNRTGDNTFVGCYICGAALSPQGPLKAIGRYYVSGVGLISKRTALRKTTEFGRSRKQLNVSSGRETARFSSLPRLISTRPYERLVRGLGHHVLAFAVCYMVLRKAYGSSNCCKFVSSQ